MENETLIAEIYDRTKTLTGTKKIRNKAVYDLLIELNSINEIHDLTKLKNKYQGELLNGVNFEISVKKTILFYDLNLKLS